MILDKLKARFKPKPDLSKSIKDIGLTFRTYHVLRKAQIDTVGDLVGLSWNDISRIRRSTRKTCEEVERTLERLGLGLREE